MSYQVTSPYTGTPGFVVTERPDDVEVRQGNSTDRTMPVTNLPGYAAQVLNNGQQIASYNVPQHDRFSRWLHEITADKIIRTPQDCIDLKLMFPYGKPGKKQPPAPGNTYSGPMSTAGVATSMGATGERPDIGLLPEWESYWMRTGIAGPMLAGSKAFDSMPIWVIDERTGRLWDLISRPMATMFWQASSQPDFIASAPDAGADKTQYPAGTVFGQWALDMAHGPAVYGAYLATGGLRHLERLQAFTNCGFLETNYYVKIMGFPICSIAQMRKFAWHLRLLFMAYRATLLAEADYPGGLPKPLLPSSYWKQHLDNQRAFIMQKWISDPALQIFKFFPDVTSYRPWQFDYLLPILLLGALILPQEWGPAALWGMDNPIQRLNGKSGYPPAYIGAYEFLTGPNMPQGGDPNNFPGTYKTTDFYPDWGAAFSAHAAAIIKAGSGWNMTAAQMNALQADPLGGGHIISWDPYPTLSLRHLMAAADHLDINGILGVRAQYSDFDLCLTRVTNYALDWESQASGNTIPARVSIVSALLSSSPPSPTPPPSGGNMIVLQGSTHTLSLANLKDANGNNQPLPSGMLPKFSASPATACTFGTQNADGSQPVTFAATYAGNVIFSGTLAYPNGDQVTLNPVTVVVSAPEDKTGDIVLT